MATWIAGTTGISQELETMKNEICEPIHEATEQLLEEYFPLDKDVFNNFLLQDCLEVLGIKQMFSGQNIQHNSAQDMQNDMENSSDLIQDYLWETKGNPLEFMKLTLRRYGCLPMAFIKEAKHSSSILYNEISEKAKYLDNGSDGMYLKECYDGLLRALNNISEKLDGLEQEAKSRKSDQYQQFLDTYQKVCNQIEKVQKQELVLLEKYLKKPDQSAKEEEYDNVDEELASIKDHILYSIRYIISTKYFIHRCKNYENQVWDKRISQKEFLELCEKRLYKIEEPASNSVKKNLNMCISAFYAVKQDGDMIVYPKVLEDILIRFITEKKWEDKLKKFEALLKKNKKHGTDYVGKKSYFYRKSIAELEKSIFGEDTNYSYELCCAWNELGGFTLSSTIEKFLFMKEMHSKAFLKAERYAKHRERFYKALKRCCKVLVDFSRTESWIQGIELARYVFCIYRNEFKGKKLSPEDTCNSMETLAETLELLGSSLEKILKNYEYHGQNIGEDGFPRAQMNQMWEDDRECFKNAFYSEESEGYSDGSNENLLYVNILQIVFECVNGGT